MKVRVYMRLRKTGGFCVLGLAGIVSPGTLFGDDAPLSERYRKTAQQIVQSVLAGNEAYDKLQQLCDDIGHRLAGSPELDQAVRWAADALRRDGQENVHLETVSVPTWHRGAESCTMLEPRRLVLAMLGLGFSVGTGPEGITAPVVVVRDEEGLEALDRAARGKIILFNNPMPPFDPVHGSGYGRAVRFRTHGARLAAEKGALACLIRSVTANSLRSPHTGMMRYDDAKVKIPAAALAIEDAAMISRLQERGIPVTLTLKMEARVGGEASSANVIAELRGTTYPDQIVVIGGHIDSWDVGQGAHDDGSGCVMAMEALHVLRKLNLRPRRTIRVVLWTAEEVGSFGAKHYAAAHAKELGGHVAAIEADIGCFQPAGYRIDCADEQRLRVATAQMREILSLCAALGASMVEPGHAGADVSPLKPAGVIIMGHEVEHSRYFDYHHTAADTIDKIDPQDLSKNVAVMATVAYVLADMPERLGERLAP